MGAVPTVGSHILSSIPMTGERVETRAGNYEPSGVPLFRYGPMIYLLLEILTQFK